MKNPHLAELLETLVARKAVDSFYRGDLAQRIADAARQNDGILSARDLARYQAREVKPLALSVKGTTIYTAPLTAGGITVLQAILILQQLQWDSIPDPNRRAHAELETLRHAWKDRLAMLGDSANARRLLSRDYAAATAERIRVLVRNPQARPEPRAAVDHRGTVHLSAADRWGNLASLTLTHGNSFGARVAVADLGLVLGHGMSRFNAEPGHPNSIAPGKRPLHNMCPTVVCRPDRPVLAVGGAGGRRIPNAVFAVLKNYCLLNQPLETAVAAGRLHTEGGANVVLERQRPPPEAAYFSQLGYQVRTGSVALVSAVGWDPHNQRFTALQR